MYVSTDENAFFRLRQRIFHDPSLHIWSVVVFCMRVYFVSRWATSIVSSASGVHICEYHAWVADLFTIYTSGLFLFCRQTSLFCWCERGEIFLISWLALDGFLSFFFGLGMQSSRVILLVLKWKGGRRLVDWLIDSLVHWIWAYRRLLGCGAMHTIHPISHPSSSIYLSIQTSLQPSL